MKQPPRRALSLLGIAVLAVGAWSLGYGTGAVNTRLQAARLALEPVISNANLAVKEFDYPPETDLQQTRKELKAARRLIERYREELASVEESNATNEGGAK